MVVVVGVVIIAVVVIIIIAVSQETILLDFRVTLISATRMIWTITTPVVTTPTNKNRQ
jgi:hypothetical protein